MKQKLGFPKLRRFPLREYQRGRWIPPVAGWLLVFVGLINVISALTPQLAERVQLLHLVTGRPEIMLLAQEIALPAGLALLLTAIYLVGRRRGALWLAVGLLIGVGVIDLLKGLDIEEALISWSLAGLLVFGRHAFCVRSDHEGPSTVLSYVLGMIAGALTLAVLALVISVPWETEPLGGPWGTVRRALALLSLTTSPGGISGPFVWVPWALELMGVMTLGLIMAKLFRRPALEQEVTDRKALLALLRSHGSDTLSFFKLRRDVDHLFSEDRKAVLSYRVERGRLMIAGDPVGPSEAFPDLLRAACSLAETQGLRVGVVGASKEFARLGKEAGLRSFYMGDEAIIPTEGFTLEGKRIKKVRQAVGRIERNGYYAELRRHNDLSRRELAQLEQVSSLWRDGESERGFSMTLDTLKGEHLDDCLLIIARNDDNHIGGFLHFVPTYGRNAVSLSFMRRDPDTPNGMTDFLVVSAIRMLREKGIQEISLNFAMFGRLFDGSASGPRKILSWLVAKSDRYFQVKSLYRFNRKFFPHWEPRYLLYEGVFGLPRTGLAALSVEGQIDPSRFRLPVRS